MNAQSIYAQLNGALRPWLTACDLGAIDPWIEV
jgi:hypothetical protein